MENNILTPQEHALIGSTVEDKYCEKPYMPLVVFDGAMSVEECEIFRRVLEDSGGGMAGYWEVNSICGAFSFEPLIFGQTMRDPVLVRAWGGKLFEGKFEWNYPFPYARGKPVVRLEDDC